AYGPRQWPTLFIGPSWGLPVVTNRARVRLDPPLTAPTVGGAPEAAAAGCVALPPGGFSFALAEGGTGLRGLGAAGAGEAGRTRFASGTGASVREPAGPLSTTSSGAMRSTYHPATILPSDRASGLAPGAAKIAMRRAGWITMPVSRTP